jgi:hypothetical protein
LDAGDRGRTAAAPEVSRDSSSVEYSPQPVNIEHIADFGAEASELIQVLLQHLHLLGREPIPFHRRVTSMRIDPETRRSFCEISLVKARSYSMPSPLR